ncbi:protein rolling stone-like [Colias croceus]|uniref:protein rolling stone-like n=1 Tax=Colias crocea TaxID=72248 RepID=UPI001E281A5A|nr:protein rolling stone-like [Colias croceus]
MGATKKYFKRQFKTQMFKLEYDDASDFYLGCFQKNRSCVPLLLLRALLFFGSVAIVIASIVLTVEAGKGAHWPIYLTHWGLVMMMISTGFGFAISVVTYIKGPIDGTFGLPWYVKAYWVLYNIALPLALFITIFYWVFLAGLADSEEAAELELAVNEVLDIFIHAINSVVMVLLLLIARQPVFILHFYQVFGFALVYMFFSLIYHFAGGVDQFGLPYIYPVLDWNQPGIAVLAVLFSAILIIIIHFLVALLVQARDAIGKCYRKDNGFSLAS